MSDWRRQNPQILGGAEVQSLSCQAVRAEAVLLPFPVSTQDIDESEERAFVYRAINAVLRTLSRRQRLVLKFRFGLGPLDGITCTLKEVGNLFGVSAGRIGQLESRAFRKLQEPFRQDRLMKLLVRS